jgi:hypothetical protein
MTVRARAALLAAGLLVVYNSNGREIGSVDTQPTKFAAREPALLTAVSLGVGTNYWPLVSRTPQNFDLFTRAAVVRRVE